MKKLGLLLMAVPLAAAAQSGLVATLHPAFNLPLGADGDYYEAGAGLALGAALPLLAVGGLEAGMELGLGIDLAPLQALEAGRRRSLLLVSGRAGPSLGYSLGPSLGLEAALEAGAFYGFLDGAAEAGAGGLLLGARGGLRLDLGPRLGLGLSAGYRGFLGLYGGLSLSLAGSVGLGTGSGRSTPPEGDGRPRLLRKGAGAELADLSFEPVFPVFYKYYDDHPVGRLRVVNRDTVPLTELRLALLVRQFMDDPKEAAGIEVLAPGEAVELAIPGLFSDRLLEVTEGSKVSALVRLSYLREGKPGVKEAVATLTVRDRNALTWDDDRKACSFVTAKDPTIQRLAKNVAGTVKGAVFQGLDQNLVLAAALHEILDLHGIAYAVDPATPYAEFSKEGGAVDYLQFPRQTLEFRAGDCDDLSILYAALLEALGVEAAFLTVPGHIYVAVALSPGAGEVAKTMARGGDLILRGGKAWLPVEVTERSRGFLAAWELGAREWREAESAGKAALLPIREGWALYEPVAFPGEGEPVAPGRDALLAALRRQLDRFVEGEVRPQAARLEAEIAATGGEPRLFNRLGVLYARYGVLDKAESAFRQALRQRDYAPALVNLGLVASLRNDWTTALTRFREARAADPRNAGALLGLVQAQLELGDSAAAAETYVQLKAASPELAGRYAHLDALRTGRSAETETWKGGIPWSE